MPYVTGLHLKWIYCDTSFVVNREWGLYQGLLLLSKDPTYFIQKRRSLSWVVISTLVCNYAGSILRPAGTTWSFINWFLTTNSSLNIWVLPLANTRSTDTRLYSWNGKASQESQKFLEIIAYFCWSKKAHPALRHLACNNKHCLLDTKIFSGESRCYPSGGQTWKMERPMPELLKTDSSLGCNNFWVPNFRYSVSDF